MLQTAEMQCSQYIARQKKTQVHVYVDKVQQFMALSEKHQGVYKYLLF